MKFNFGWLLIVIATLSLYGCGLKGPLEQPQPKSDPADISFTLINNMSIYQLI